MCEGEHVRMHEGGEGECVRMHKRKKGVEVRGRLRFFPTHQSRHTQSFIGMSFVFECYGHPLNKKSCTFKH